MFRPRWVEFHPNTLRRSKHLVPSPLFAFSPPSKLAFMSEKPEDFSVSGQISPEDVAEIAKAGFKSIICNRPDGEQPGQPTFAEIETAASALGLEARYIPVIPGQAGPDEVEAFAAAIKEMPKPLLAYCRSGARSNMMFQLAQSE